MIKFLISDCGNEYLTELPDGYVKMPQYREIFKKVDLLTTDNAVIRDNIVLLIYNPQTKEYYPRYLYHCSNKEDLLRYFNDGNIYINKDDIIW